MGKKNITSKEIVGKVVRLLLS